MERTLAGLTLVVAVAAAGVWAVASMVPPTGTPVREPALVVPVVGSPSPAVTLAPTSPTPSASASSTPSVTLSPDASAPGTAAAPKPSYYDDDDDDDRDDDDDDDRDDDDDDDDDDD